MKILYVALKYDYGKKERGYSFEHNNFYDALLALDGGRHQITYFAFDEIMRAAGRAAMNERLIETVKTIRPDLTFFCIFGDEIDKKTLAAVKNLKLTTTFNWFTDDHWRFDNFSKYWCWNFDYIGTTDSHAPANYARIGYEHCVKTQWACNTHMYTPSGKAISHDLTFVGQAHGNRPRVAAQIRQAGITVECWGSGWPHGRISQEKLIEIFSTSKINLNLTNSSDIISKKSIAKIFVYRRSDETYHAYSPLAWLSNITSLLHKRREQIKGRNFEVPGTGGFLLTADADNLRDYYQDGKEIVIFKDTADLIEKARYYISHDAEREAIAKAGYERTLREHTYEKRFKDIFKAMKLQI